MARLVNGPKFNLDLLVGRQLDALCGATESENDFHIEMLFIHLISDENWHRLFLQAGIGFWEYMSKEDAFYDFEDLRLIDFASRWHLLGSRIESATCKGGGWQDDTFSQFSIVLDAGEISLSFTDSSDMESSTAISFSQFNEPEH